MYSCRTLGIEEIACQERLLLEIVHPANRLFVLTRPQITDKYEFVRKLALKIGLSRQTTKV